jgi:hypothetical protein
MNDEFPCIDRHNHGCDHIIPRCALVLENPQLEADAMADAEMISDRLFAFTCGICVGAIVQTVIIWHWGIT